MQSKSLKARSKRDDEIMSQLWKCDQIARKISAYSGLSFEELRDTAREYVVKIHSTWDPAKANFSTWVNRCLNFYMLNYLRDHSRLIRIPRSYSDMYLKIRKLQKKYPSITDVEVAEILNVSVKKIRCVLEAFSMKFSGSSEFCGYEETLSSEQDDGLLQTAEYKEVLMNISNLDPQDEAFLNDYLIKKRSSKTLLKNYPHISSAESIKDYSDQLIDKILYGKT